MLDLLFLSSNMSFVFSRQFTSSFCILPSFLKSALWVFGCLFMMSFLFFHSVWLSCLSVPTLLEH